MVFEKDLSFNILVNFNMLVNSKMFSKFVTVWKAGIPSF
jgi:hypothetical protein